MVKPLDFPCGGLVLPAGFRFFLLVLLLLTFVVLPTGWFVELLRLHAHHMAPAELSGLCLAISAAKPLKHTGDRLVHRCDKGEPELPCVSIGLDYGFDDKRGFAFGPPRWFGSRSLAGLYFCFPFSVHFRFLLSEQPTLPVWFFGRRLCCWFGWGCRLL
jgi:hypothetical protein